MGYGMRMREHQFEIRADDKPRALALARGLLGPGGRRFSWVDPGEMASAASVEEMLRAWRWVAVVDGGGTVVGLEFEGEKLGDDLALWEAIAPAVADGSYIEMVGEDGALWRWFFAGDACLEQHGTVSWA